VDYWQIYRDGVLYATSTTTSYTDTALSPGENHTYYIASSSTQTYSIPSRSLTITAKTPDNSLSSTGSSTSAPTYGSTRVDAIARIFRACPFTRRSAAARFMLRPLRRALPIKAPRIA